MTIRGLKQIAEIRPQFGLTRQFRVRFKLPEKADDSFLYAIMALGDNCAEPDIITKSMRPDDVSDEAVCDLLATMEDAQWRAMSLYAKLLRVRDAPGS